MARNGWLTSKGSGVCIVTDNHSHMVHRSGMNKRIAAAAINVFAVNNRPNEHSVWMTATAIEVGIVMEDRLEGP